MRVTVILIVLIIAGCASSRPALDRIDPATIYEVESVLDSVWAHSLPTSLQARGDLSMKTPLYSGTVTAEISHRRADSLLMVFRVRGLNIEGGRLLVTQDSLFFYDRFAQTLGIAGSGHPALPALFSVQNAIEQMLGYVRPIRGTPLQLKSTQDGLVLTDSLMHRTYTVDPEHWRTVQMVQHDASGTLMEALYFNDFFAVGEEFFPRQIIYRNPAISTNAILYYRSLLIDEPIASMSLDLPNDVNRVPLPEE
ncbi:MAG: DUF4292 domain-containing protein [Rhodothermaceae bacterium]|nr:DUF4292 domain-containing protein [Rhodothermaceae bacterium]MXZ58250.1 DUF4292 domain-containing protein [Rhodothermaceae bacterium]MYB91199.1 DUF4292 domain-containing protein [Rhodothermaceae bacterium]MYD67683.1 DUF4292 domain-containing protein [Rhodothermaceae bacterium]MYG43972.1 DUF4292 domain-containing protein [Rhodothermaceae bacterium]